MAPAPKLPTYQAIAAFLERQNGSGTGLLVYTIMRAGLIYGGLRLAGVRDQKAWRGALVASGLISLFVILRMQVERKALEAGGSA